MEERIKCWRFIWEVQKITSEKRSDAGKARRQNMLLSMLPEGHLELSPIRKLWNGVKHLTQNHLCNPSHPPQKGEGARAHTHQLRPAEGGVHSLEFPDCYIGERPFLAMETNEKTKHKKQKWKQHETNKPSGTESSSENKERSKRHGPGLTVNAPELFP